MSDLTHLFKVGQKVKVLHDDFEGRYFKNGIVKETYPDHIIVNLTETNTNCWYEHGFGIDMVYPDYNF